MMIDGAAGKRRQRCPRARDRGVAGIVRIVHDGVRTRDVEVGADQGHAERRVEMIEEDGLRPRLGVIRIVPQ
jgi:hypothetical protein